MATMTTIAGGTVHAERSQAGQRARSGGPVGMDGLFGAIHRSAMRQDEDPAEADSSPKEGMAVSAVEDTPTGEGKKADAPEPETETDPATPVPVDPAFFAAICFGLPQPEPIPDGEDAKNAPAVIAQAAIAALPAIILQPDTAHVPSASELLPDLAALQNPENGQVPVIAVPVPAAGAVDLTTAQALYAPTAIVDDFSGLSPQAMTDPPAEGSIKSAEPMDQAPVVRLSDALDSGDPDNGGKGSTAKETAADPGLANARRLRPSDSINLEYARVADTAAANSANPAKGPDALTQGPSIVRQIVDSIEYTPATGAAGSEEMVLRLKPDVLGELRIRLEMKDDVLNAQISTDSHPARILLQAHLSRLQDALQEKGILVQDIKIEYSAAGNDGRPAGEPGNNRPHQQMPQNEFSGLGRSAQAEASERHQRRAETRRHAGGIDLLA